MVGYEVMTGAHFDEALALWKATEGVGLAVGDSREEIARYLRRNAGLSWVAVSGGSVAGTILCGHDGRRGYVYHLAVRRDLRGRGIGGELVRRGMEGLKAEGIGRCQLMVKTGNDAGGTFWEKRGWRRRGDLLVHSRDL